MKSYDYLPIETTQQDEKNGFIQRTISEGYFPLVNQQIEIILKVNEGYGGFQEMFDIVAGD